MIIKLKCNKNRLHCNRGFTLLELAICLIIVSVVMGGGLLVVSQYIKSEKVKQTQQKMDTVMNVLSTYVQAHYRLPCPADPGAVGASVGQEANNGKCFTNSAAGDIALYKDTQGILPWKELGIPQDMVVDAWNHYITYKPAPLLTVDVQKDTMQGNDGTAQSTPVAGQNDIHNACRSPQWYDDKGNHLNRAKALFCCNAPPKTNYLTANGQLGNLSTNTTWRKTGILDTSTASLQTGLSKTAALSDTTSVFATNNWMDANTDIVKNGPFTPPNGSNGQAPLLRATGNAVTLISHGGDGNMAFLFGQDKTHRLGATVSDNGVSGAGVATVEQDNAWPPQLFTAVIGHPKVNDGSYDPLNPTSKSSDDIVAYERSDQLFAKAGKAGCAPPPAPHPYKCISNDFAKNTKTGGTASDYFGLSLNGKIPGVKYAMSTSYVRQPGQTGAKSSLLYYQINKDGMITNVQLVDEDASHTLSSTDAKKIADKPINSDTTSIGMMIFITGLTKDADTTSRFKDIDLDSLQLIYNNGQPGGRPVKITDTDPDATKIKLYGKSTIDGTLKQISSGNSSARPADLYHLASNLNFDGIGHTMEQSSICQGPNGNVTCTHWNDLDPEPVMSFVGADPGDSTHTQIGFEDIATPACYYTSSQGNPCVCGTTVVSNPTNNSPTCYSRPTDAVSDGHGGYKAYIGDNDYNDVAFRMNMSICPTGN